jgi:asparagine synthetase B (glutamine-hydrolysing)
VLETAKYSRAELQERFDALMDQAASRCVTGRDVVSLSGGVDSPAIAAFAAPRHLELSGRPLHALSAVFPRFPSVDERRYVELVSDRLDLPLHVYEQRVNALDRLGDWVALVDGPFHAASLAQYEEHYRQAREKGFRTVFTGEAAEFVVDMRTHLLGHLLTHGRLRAARRVLQAHRKAGTPAWWLPVLIARGLAPRAAVAAKRRRTRFDLPEWVDLRRANEAAATSYVSARERWRKLQLAAFIGPGLSGEAEEICQTVCGVRTRRPWTDVDLFEFFLSLPAEVKFPDHRDKSLVRSLLRGHVPDEILDRRDRTVFDAAVLGDLDYTTLRRFLLNPSYRLPGIDYDALAERLRNGRLESIQDYVWARNLAAAHAFLSLW